MYARGNRFRIKLMYSAMISFLPVLEYHVFPVFQVIWSLLIKIVKDLTVFNPNNNKKISLSITLLHKKDHWTQNIYRSPDQNIHKAKTKSISPWN